MRYLRLRTLLLVMLLLLSLVGCNKQSEEDREMVLFYRDKAQSYLDAGDFQAARDVLEEGALHTGDKDLLRLMKEVESRISELPADAATNEQALSDSGEPAVPTGTEEAAESADQTLQEPDPTDQPTEVQSTEPTQATAEPAPSETVIATTEAPTQPTQENLAASFGKSDRKRINVFLSNFSEVFFDNFGGKDDYDALALEDYAYLHYKINDFSKLSVKDAYYVLSKENMDHCLNRFFGFTISPETRSRTNNGYTYTVEYKNNAYYYPAADGESYNSFTVVRTMTRYDGHYLVEFDVYELDLETYWEKGFSDLYYELTADEAASRSDVSYSYSGIAEVRDYTNGTFKSYQLLNYKVE